MAKVSQEQPEKFFSEAKDCLDHLTGIPIVAIDALREDESRRDVLISILRTCYRILDDAGLDIEQEIEKQDIRNVAGENLKRLMVNDRLVSLEELAENGLKIAMGKSGPMVVPV